VSGDSVVWTDHENRTTAFPLPSDSRPAITNSLAEAAIYLGASPDELVLAQASRFFHFRDGVLTAISDAYDNRLRIFRDALGRIERLDNGVGRSLCLRYAAGRIVAVDYQIQRAKGPEPFEWVTEQNVVSYTYDEAGRLISATNAVGEREVYRYDEQHVILERGLAGGASFFWAWALARRPDVSGIGPVFRKWTRVMPGTTTVASRCTTPMAARKCMSTINVRGWCSGGWRHALQIRR
jgi:YD repeat-containing protein